MKQGGSSVASILPVLDTGIGVTVLDVPAHKEEVETKLDTMRDISCLTLRHASRRNSNLPKR